MERIYEQSRVITSPFNEKIFLKGLKSELASKIFKELINEEKHGIKITVTMDVIEDATDI